MAFQLIRNRPLSYRKRETEPYVEILPSGRMRFNEIATKQVLEPLLHGNDEEEHVQLLFDPNNQLIGIRPVSKDVTNDVFRARSIRSYTMRTIAAKRFFKEITNQFQIDMPKQDIKVRPEIMETTEFGKIIVFPLNENIIEMVEAEAAATKEEPS